VVETELREHVEDIGARQTVQIQQNLDALRDFTKTIATNDLIINGLIDLEGRIAYLPIFFHSLTAPFDSEASVFLVDYKGRNIISNNDAKTPPSLPPTMIAEEVLILEPHQLLIIQPILISGSPEGAIVLSYPVTSYEKLFGKSTLPHSYFLIDESGQVVYSTNSQLTSEGEFEPGESIEGWLQVRYRLQQTDLTVAVVSSIEVAFESMDAVQFLRIVELLTILAVLIGLVMLSVFIVSRPLKKFSEVISTIRGVGDLDKHLDTKGPREIADIATTFNRMEGWLQSTTVSRNYMDNILASITEGVITIDHKGLIMTFNTGASNIFGYDSSQVVGQNVSMLLPSGERDDHDSYLANSRLHAARIIGQNRDLNGLREDGSLFPMELTVTPLTEGGNKGFVGTIRDITERKITEQSLEQRSQELKRINKELEYLALNDSLTGLGNRNLFTDRLITLIATYKRNQNPFSLLMMDLNKFKQVNDTHGHDAGDEVLHEVGKRLTTLGRDSDSFFRLGGDEFAALITTGVTREGLAIMARRIISAFETPIEYKSVQLEIGISIGVVIFPEHSEDEEELLRLADAAMYEAKRGQLGFSIPSTIDNQATR
jgi:diguanylate cyclase (GGDEF)-like protein/PAS domain S-box-containing protein